MPLSILPNTRRIIRGSPENRNHETHEIHETHELPWLDGLVATTAFFVTLRADAMLQ